MTALIFMTKKGKKKSEMVINYKYKIGKKIGERKGQYGKKSMKGKYIYSKSGQYRKVK